MAMARTRKAPSTTMLLDSARSLVEGEALHAQEVHVLAGAIQGWVGQLDDLVGQTDRQSQLRVHGLLEALAAGTERLTTLTGQLADGLGALSAPGVGRQAVA